MKYTAEEVRAIAKRLHDDITVADGDALMASDMLTDYAERIQADESTMPAATSCADHAKGETGYCTFHTQVSWGTKLFTHPPAQAAQGEASLGRCKACGRATRAVCDGLDGNGLGCTNAPPIDIAAVRKVIAHLRQFDNPYTRGLADKLEAALQEKGNG